MKMTDLPFVRRACRVLGFTLVELLLVIGGVSAVTALAVVTMRETESVATATKLDQDMAVLNAAVKTYRSQGGEFPSGSNSVTVLQKLKSKVAAADAHKVAGMRGAMVDPRLAGVAVRTKGVRRAVWSQGQQKFNMVTNQTSTALGFSEFFLDETQSTAAPEEESRRVTLAMSNESGWVWGFDDEGGDGVTASTQQTSSFSESDAAADPGGLVRLSPPEFTPSGDNFDFSAFTPNLPVSLVNPNPSNTADMFYSVDGGTWIRWTGTPILVPPNYTSVLRAFSSPLDPDRYEQSDLSTETYETVFFTGSATGKFRSVVGDSGLVSNIRGGGETDFFTFGDPARSLGWTTPNWLFFEGATFDYMAPDEEFVLGTLSYYNSTTWSGTNATRVTLRMYLNLTSPGTSQQLDFRFDLLSTTNNGVSQNADADYVWIPTLSTNFNTIIHGKRYALSLRFGEHTSSGFTTIDTFHAWEGNTLSGYVYGRFVESN